VRATAPLSCRISNMLPELEAIGFDAIRHADGGRVEPHVHETFELCFVERGEVWTWIEDELLEVSGGHVYVTWPGERHGAVDDAVNPCRRYLVRVDLRASRFLGLPRDEAAAVTAALRELPRRSFPAPRETQTLFEQLLADVEADATPLRLARVRASLLQLLLTLVDAAATDARTRESDVVAEAKRLLGGRLDRRISAEELARELGWSVSHLQHRFREEVGMPPGEWQLRRRVAAGCRLLVQTDEPVTRIAHSLGFPSSQYFATAFARVTGATPTAYRATRRPVQAPEPAPARPSAAA
jgi:AraC-like DNA-binding protein